MTRRNRAWWLVLTVALAALDLWTKSIWGYPARIGDPPVVQRVLFESWIQIRTVWNEGGLWSLPVAPTILKWATFTAIPLLGLWIFRPPTARRAETGAKAMILGGAIGNLHDRMRWDAVRDFIDVFFGGQQGWHWPTFNIADMSLVCGISLLLIVGIRPPPREATA